MPGNLLFALLKLILVVIATILLFIVGLYWTVALRFSVPRYPGPVSEHFDGRVFHNLDGTVRPRGFGRFLLMRLERQYFRGSKEPALPAWPVWVDAPQGAPPPKRVEGLRITFVNHATMLIQLDGLNVLTDPQWSERASPFSWVGPKRHRAPGIRFEDLPPIDLVLVSHNHYDHMDLPTLRHLEQVHHARILTPLANAAFLKTQGLAATDLDWWQSETLPGGLKITAVPSRHFSARSTRDRNFALWGGFMIEVRGRKIYFAGDAGYSPAFAEIGRRFSGIDVAILPIGAYLPRDFMKPVHVSPEEAVQAALDLGARVSVPMHYGTFKLSEEGIDQPVQDLREALARRGNSAPAFVVLQPGEGKEF